MNSDVGEALRQISASAAQALRVRLECEFYSDKGSDPEGFAKAITPDVGGNWKLRYIFHKGPRFQIQVRASDREDLLEATLYDSKISPVLTAKSATSAYDARPANAGKRTLYLELHFESSGSVHVASCWFFR